MVLSDVQYVDRSKVRSSQLLRKGDILVCTSSGSKGLVGKAALVKRDVSATFGAFCCVLRSLCGEADYLGHYFQSGVYRRTTQEVCYGSNINNLKPSNFYSLTVPIYVKSDRERIVNILDLLANLIELSRCRLSLLDDLVKSRFVEMFGDGSSFCQLPLSACVSAIDSGKSPKCAPGPRRGTKPGVLKLSGISSGVYLEHENKALPSEDSFVAAKEVIDGDILLARKNTPELVGRSVLVHKTAGRIMFPDIVFRMHPNDDVEGAYLSHLLGGPYFDKVRSLAHGSAKSMSNIPKSELARLCVPVPPLALQREFAAFAAEVGKSRVVVQQQVLKYNDVKASSEVAIIRRGELA